MEVDHRKPPPGGISVSVGSQMKSLHEEDPPQLQFSEKNVVVFQEGVLFLEGNHPKRKPPRGKGGSFNQSHGDLSIGASYPEDAGQPTNIVINFYPRAGLPPYVGRSETGYWVQND